MAAHFDNWKLEVVSKHFRVRAPERSKHEAKGDRYEDNRSENDDLETIVGETLLASSCSAGLADIFDEYACDMLEDIEDKGTKNVDNELIYVHSAVDVIIEEILTTVIQRFDSRKSFARFESEDFGEDVVLVSNDLNVVNDEIDDRGLNVIDRQNNVFDGLVKINLAEGEDVDELRSNSCDDEEAQAGSFFQNKDVRLKEHERKISKGSMAKSDTGGSCVSVILVWDRNEFYKKLGGKRGAGKVRIRNLALTICSCLRGELKYKCQSTIGNQLRNDFVFSNETQALQFFEKVNGAKVPESVSKIIDVSKEEDFGLGLEHVLSEEDVLTLVTFAPTDNLFRHFLQCRILVDGGQIIFKFSSLSDVNLFLFNKSFPRYKLLGRLRKLSQLHKFKLVSNEEEGALVLETKDFGTPTRVDSWDDLSSRFMFKTQIMEGCRRLLFRNNRDLFSFFVSDEAKELTSLRILPSQIVKQNNKKIEDLAGINVEPFTVGANERHQDLESRLASKKKELEFMKKKILRSERGIEANGLSIQKLRLKICALGDVIPSTLSIHDVLKLEFKDENETSSNYPLCLRTFLQSDDLVKVEEVDEDIIFFFSSSENLEKLLNFHCKKTAQKWSAVSQLPLRAGFVPEKLSKTYGLLVHLEETSIIKKPIKQVEDELKARNAKVEYRAYGLVARYPTLLSFLQGLVDREITSHHRVMFMKENIVFMRRTDGHKFFKGRACLAEEDCLRLQWKNSEENHGVKDNISVENFLFGFSKFLLDPRVEEVSEDWTGRLVLSFDSEESLDSLLVDHCVAESSHVTRLSGLPVLFALRGPSYSVSCPPNGTDFRHFFMIDNNCYPSSDFRKISSSSRLFPFLCLTSQEMRAVYPSLRLHSDDYVRLS